MVAAADWVVAAADWTNPWAFECFLMFGRLGHITFKTLGAKSGYMIANSLICVVLGLSSGTVTLPSHLPFELHW